MTDDAPKGYDDVWSLAKSAVVQVGAGRGFIVGAGDHRYVVTAAHCLPRSRFPRPHLANSVPELTFPKIIGPLASKQRTIWGELCVISLTDDVAVFSEPDGQVLCDQCAEFEEFAKASIPIGNPPEAIEPHLRESHPGAAAFMLSLDGEWQSCTVHNGGRFLVISDGAGFIRSGMSGEPIIDANGGAIGLMSTSGSGGVNTHPSLTDCLPPWLLRKLDIRSIRVGGSNVRRRAKSPLGSNKKQSL